MFTILFSTFNLKWDLGTNTTSYSWRKVEMKKLSISSFLRVTEKQEVGGREASWQAIQSVHNQALSTERDTVLS